MCNGGAAARRCFGAGATGVDSKSSWPACVPCAAGSVEQHDAGTTGPADASIVKLFYSELLQRMTDFATEIAGLETHTVLQKPRSSGWESGAWMLDFLGSWEWTIPGGSSEIQRTIIGERGLGLPREPAVG